MPVNTQDTVGATNDGDYIIYAPSFLLFASNTKMRKWSIINLLCHHKFSSFSTHL
jgi:hypothetical protein